MMILNRKDGSSERFDLTRSEDVERLNRLGQNPGQVSGIWINSNGYCTTLPLPSGFRRVSFLCRLLKKKDGSPSGEELTFQIDDFRTIVTTYYGDHPKMVKINMKRTGRQRFAPEDL